MTDQEMIARFSDLEDQDGIFAARIVACEVNQRLISEEMTRLKKEWMKTHKCACKLWRIPDSECTHKKD